MTGRFLSQTAKARQHNDTTEKWMERAVNLYKDENGDGTGKKLGLKTVCSIFTEQCWAEDHVQIYLDKETL